MKFPDSWTGSNPETAGTPPRRHWRASAARWVLLAVAVTGGLVWASQVLPSRMSSILHHHQHYHDVTAPHKSTLTTTIGDGDDELNDTDSNGGNATQSSWPHTSSWQFITFDLPACALNPPYPILWDGEERTNCITVKSGETSFKYYKFLSTVSTKEVDFMLCLWNKANCYGTPDEIRKEVLCSDIIKAQSWAVLGYGGNRGGRTCKNAFPS